MLPAKLVKTGMVMVAGEITTEANVDVESLVRDVVDELVQPPSSSTATCAVVNAIGRQSTDIAMGVDESEEHEQGPAIGVCVRLCHQ